MNIVNIFDYLPQHKKQELIDKLIETIADKADKIHSGLGREIRSLSTQDSYRQAFAEAIQKGKDKFMAEYAAVDVELIEAIENDSSVWLNSAFHEALVFIVSHPGAFLDEEHLDIIESFKNNFPDDINVERIDKAIIKLFEAIAEEIWTLPAADSIREVYSLKFQKISAETTKEHLVLARENTDLLKRLGADISSSINLLSDVVREKITLLPPQGLNDLDDCKIKHNLPSKDYLQFIGRSNELDKLMQYLSPEWGINLITVDGIGGVGKTALVIETCYRCLKKGDAVEVEKIPDFDAIIFISAKQNALTSSGIIPLLQAQRTLRDIYHEIAVTLDRIDILQLPQEEQQGLIRRIFSKQRVLLVVDNLETIEDKMAILSFLYELPSKTKRIITTRERNDYAPIRLIELPKPQGIDLIMQKTFESELNIDIKSANKIYDATGGIPAAIIYTIGQMSYGYSLDAVVDKVKNASEDVARFCFKSSVDAIKSKPSYELLLSISIFPAPPLRSAVTYVAGYSTDPIVTEEGLVDLQRLSLVTQTNDRYKLLPLTREYALAELSRNLMFENKVRINWIDWYMKFVNTYGGDAYQEEWHIQYDNIDKEWENILEVLNWTATNDQYDFVRTIWEPVMAFSAIYGYWSDHLVWSEWMIEASERRGDHTVLLEHLYQKAWTLQRMGDYGEALKLHMRAWSLKNYAERKNVVVKIANRIAQINMHLNDLKGAEQWVKNAEEEVNKIMGSQKTREIIHIIYTKAMICRARKDFTTAAELLQKGLGLSESINWQRGIIWIQRLMAETRIDLKELHEAEQILDVYYPSILRNKDKRGIALYERAYALLENAQGNLIEMNKWARSAIKAFNSLGMSKEALEMKKILNG